MNIPISIFKGVRANQTQIVSELIISDFDSLKDSICKNNWSPFEFEYVENHKTKKGDSVTGHYRSIDTSKSSVALSLDFDEGLTISEAVKICKDLNYCYLVGTTKSHQKWKDKKPPCDRFRLILFFDRKVDSKAEYSLIWTYFNKVFGEKLDSSCCDAGRFYYPCINIVDENKAGKSIEVDAILPLCKKDVKIAGKLSVNSLGMKGSLFQSTIDFILKGRIEESWHKTFFKAGSDLRDQGYSEAEAQNILTLASRFQQGQLDSTDLEQIKDIYSREIKYTFRPSQGLTWSSINEAAFIGPIGTLTNLIRPHTEADPNGILVQALCLFGNLIGKNKFFTVEDTTHTTNIFSVMVGETSGGRKGTGYDRAESILKMLDNDWNQNCIVKGGLASGEGVIHAVRDGQRHTTNEKKDKNYDPGVKDKRLFVQEAEFASVLRVISREANTLSAIIRNAWDHGNLRNLSKNSPQKATAAHISINGHITSEELLRYLNATELCNGFANRFLWVRVKRYQILPFGGAFDKENIQPTLNELSKAVDFGKEKGKILFSEDAKKIWEDIYYSIANLKKQGIYGAITARAEAYILRLSMLYAITELSNEILPRHIQAAKAIWDYCDWSCETIFENKTGDQTVDQIKAALDIKPEGISRTEIRDIFNRNKTQSEIERAIKILISKKIAFVEIRTEKGSSTEYLVKIKNSEQSETQSEVH